MRALWIVIAASTTGCLRQTAFQCATDSECGAGGVCEAVKYCSFPDPSCGQRFGPQAGIYANQCVTGSTDARVADTTMPIHDSRPAGDAARCPMNFVTLPGITGHEYLLIASGNDWTSQATACTTFSSRAYLGFPTDATELAALDTFAAAATAYWIGIDDIQTPGTFETIAGAAATYLPWQAGDPDLSPPPKQCVDVVTANAMFANGRCNTSLPAICECDP